jgi:protein-S-isoprenylcysteine O-methyltransferase Ste14
MDDFLPFLLQCTHNVTLYTAKFLSLSTPLRNYVASLSSSNPPDLKNVALLLLCLYLGLMILRMTLGWVWNMVVGVIRMMILFAIILVLVWGWNVGFGEVMKTLADIGRMVGEEATRGMENGMGIKPNRGASNGYVVYGNAHY